MVWDSSTEIHLASLSVSEDASSQVASVGEKADSLEDAGSAITLSTKYSKVTTHLALKTSDQDLSAGKLL